ncbi:uncharacterized protein LOC111088825 [Limulus polyphemus]|uniref:Uncharacterized protein LOC111088825 n=1 Tax=Limulus polyphemus TaxID=6850 RepID=A0ABM1TIA5_LIMPO|nr:uncharacterized protein LOC111088825 [Limulus polyphemus]
MLASEVLEVNFLFPKNDTILQIDDIGLEITFPVIDGYTNYVCSKWTNDSWKENYCKTEEIRESQHYIKCTCLTPGLYSVSAIPSNISESVMAKTLQTSAVNDSESATVIIGVVDVKNINFKEQKRRFLNQLRYQLAENMGIQTSQIERVVLDEDELLLKFIVLPGFNNSTPSLTSAIHTLYHMTNNEVLNLTDLAGERVRIIPYTLSLNNSLPWTSNDILENTVVKASRLTVIQILIIISAVIGMMLVASLVVLKYRCKKMIKVVPITSHIDVPP